MERIIKRITGESPIPCLMPCKVQKLFMIFDQKGSKEIMWYAEKLCLLVDLEIEQTEETEMDWENSCICKCICNSN